MIEVKNLHKAFGPVVAVEDVSFTAANGAITGLLGPNGAGKTTTLRMLYTLLQPGSGSAVIDGYDTALAALEAQPRLAALPDTRRLYPHLTPPENIRYYGRLHGLKGRELEYSIN